MMTGPGLMRIAVSLGLFSAGISAEKVPAVVLYPDGDAPLVQKYAEYNRRWFDDKLPAKSVAIEWGDLTGTYYTNYEGEGFHARISIIRKVEGYDNRVCMEILHEMVHLKLAISDKDLFGKDSSTAHGAEFQQEMLSLATRGAFADCW
jgi:hypothetical protein